MKNKKLLIIILGSLLALTVGGLAAIPYFIDAQSLKIRIMAQLETALQRKVSVQEAEITVFTGPGIRLRRIAIFDDPRFAATPFVTLDSLAVKPRLLPLLRGKLEMASVQLDAPTIQLIKNPQGVWNFESLGQQTSAAAGQPTGTHTLPRSQPTAAPPSEPFSLAISLVRLRDGTLLVRKLSSSGKLEESRYQHIGLELRNVSPEETATFQLSLELPGSERGSLKAAGRIGPLNLSQLQKARLEGKIQFAGAPVAGFAAMLASPANEAQWMGHLTTDLQVQGSLENGFLVDGKMAYSALGSRRSTHESPRVNGELQLKLGYQPSTNVLKIESAELRMPNSSVRVAGSLRNEAEIDALDVSVDSPKLVFDDLLKLASVFGQGPPSGVDASGVGKLALLVKGSSKQPRIDGEARFSDVRLSYPGLSEKIALSPLLLTFKETTLSSNAVQLSVGTRTQLQSQIAASFGPDAFVELQLRSQKPLPVADLLAIGASFGFTLPPGTSLQKGSIDLQVSARKFLGSNAQLRLNGQAELNNAQVKTVILKVPMDVRTVQLKFTGTSASIGALAASLAGSNLDGRLQVSDFSAPLLTFALHVDKLDLAKLDQIINMAEAPAKNAANKEAPWLPAGAAARLSLLEQGVVLAAPAATPAGDPLAALDIRDSSVAIDQVVYDQLLLKQVSSRVRMRNKLLELQDLKFQMNQGTHLGAASFDFNGAKPRYTFTSKLKDVDANEFLSQNSSLKNVFYGRFSSDMDLKGEGSGFDEIVKQLKGGGKLTLVKGRITSFNLTEQLALLGKLTGLEFGKAGTDIEDLVSNFTIQDGRVSTTAMHVRLPGLAVRATGTFGLDKTADYQLLAELPAATSKKYEDASQLANLAAATFFKNENGNIVLPLRMTGIITNPRFALDTKVVQENLKNSFRKDGVRKTLDTLQNVFKPKTAPAQEEGPSRPGSEPQQNAAPADKPAEKEKKPSPLEEWFRGIVDKAKEKKKTEEQKQ